MLQRNLFAGICLALLLGLSPAYAANRADVSEYNSLVISSGYLAQISPEPGTDQTPIDFSGGATQSAAFGAHTTYIWLMCDTQCSYLVGANPTATTANKRLPALTPIFIGVQAGQKISVVASP